MSHSLSPQASARILPILQRRSIRRYQSRSLEPDAIEALLTAAMAAPSACAKDPWRFVVVENRSTLERLAGGLSHGKFLAQAAVGIVVCGDLEAAHDRQLSYLLQDCSAAIENLLLAAHLLGLGACWLGVHPRAARMEHIRSVLAIPVAILPISCISIGYAAQSKEARSRYDASRVHHERW